MRFSMTGGGGSMIKKGSAAEKQKLMKLDASDRYKLLTARKMAEITEKMIMRKFADPDPNSGGEVKSSKAKKMIEAMVKSQGKQIVKKVEDAIALKEKERKEQLKRATSGTVQTAAQKAAEAQKQKDAMQSFLNNFYNKDGCMVKQSDDKGWW